MNCYRFRPQELCESRGGRNSPCGLYGLTATLNLNLYRRCVKVEVDVQAGSPSLIVLMVSVDVSNVEPEHCLLSSSKEGSPFLVSASVVVSGPGQTLFGFLSLAIPCDRLVSGRVVLRRRAIGNLSHMMCRGLRVAGGVGERLYVTVHCYGNTSMILDQQRCESL